MGNIINVNERSYKIILSYIKNSINSIIGKYYSEGYIKNCLDCKIRTILKLPDKNNLLESKILGAIIELLNAKINRSSELDNILKNNDELKKLLREYGIKVLFCSSRDTDKDSIIKNLIIDYFLSNGDTIKDKQYFQMEYSVYSSSGILETNIIKQLELLLGEEVLAIALESGTEYLSEQIDFKCSKKGLGNSIIDSIVNIKRSHDRINRFNYEYELYRDSISKQFKINVPKDSSNYSDEAMSKVSDKINLEILNSEERALVERYINQFDLINNEGEYADKDKIEYMININSEKLENEYDSFCVEWDLLNKIIVYEAAKKYIHKNNKKVDLDMIIKLGTYRLNNKTYGLKDKYKTKLIQRKNNKANQ